MVIPLCWACRWVLNLFPDQRRMRPWVRCLKRRGCLETLALCFSVYVLVLIVYTEDSPPHKQRLVQSTDSNRRALDDGVFKAQKVTLASISRQDQSAENVGGAIAPLTGDTPIISHGELLAERVNNKCSTQQTTSQHFVKRRPSKIPITTNTHHKLLFCPMCKLASTYWTRFFSFLRLSHSNFSSPFHVPLSLAPPTKERMTVLNKQNAYYQEYYKFMFVRDPFSRILSAYVDKFFAPNPIFWRGNAKKIVFRLRDKTLYRNHCGADMTFKEYVQAIIVAHNKTEGGSVDCHDQSFVTSCHPCEVKYSFIGKMESFTADSLFLYQKLGLNDTIRYLTSHGKALADDDALYDTVASPFKWRKDITKCITWPQALHRIWKKLQIRGVVGKDPFPLSNEEADKITSEDFIKLVQLVQANTTYTDRKLQRKEALQEIYSTLSYQQVKQLVHVFKADFDLFEYNTQPDWIANKIDLKSHHGYLTI